MLLDFESDSELDQLRWRCHALYSLSGDHATHGARSLKLELFPADYPGMEFSPAIKDWSHYKELHLDVFNPGKDSLRLTMRIDDKKNYPDYADLFNKSFMINTGANHIAIPLDSMATSGSNRNIDRANIHRVFIFTAHPKGKTTLFIDAIKLL